MVLTTWVWYMIKGLMGNAQNNKSGDTKHGKDEKGICSSVLLISPCIVILCIPPYCAINALVVLSWADTSYDPVDGLVGVQCRPVGNTCFTAPFRLLSLPADLIQVVKP